MGSETILAETGASKLKGNTGTILVDEISSSTGHKHFNREY